MPIKNGDKVKIEYVGTLDDGTVFDSSEKHGKPLEFEVGAKQVIKGFEDAIIGMEKGGEKFIKLEASEAYGNPTPQLIKKVPRDKMPKEELKPGMVLAVSLANGAQVPAKITQVTGTEVTIDLNHPLAGKSLNFKIKAVDVSSS
ncbi:peptidylprolyl isomerase [Candidatus Woesearchaeota archaeon]|nr:peptidylprolyl isomerase [Candidatus Woesearchaeota archaeon]